MSYKIKLEPEARQDIRETIKWYEERLEGLGDKFYRRVVDSLDIIKKYPTSYAVKYKNTRTYQVKKFPFLIHYYIDNNVIVVVGVIHTSRDPQIGKQRSK
jgi:mRNA-degrading endonuclease RelE of RelBE toxin-antitoxin system